MADRPRAIIHLDLDAFFAAVEVLEDPDLAGKPVVVGGRPEERGVVVASYPARAFGIRSAMPMSRALALCPQAIVRPPRHRLYREYSRRVMAILREVTPLMEQMSVDEAYLDVTDQVADWEETVEVAQRLQDRVRVEVGLSASLGVATNKLAQLGITTVGELAQWPAAELQACFGQHGAEMAQRAQGIDPRPVVVDGIASSRSRGTCHDRASAGRKCRRRTRRLDRGAPRALRQTHLPLPHRAGARSLPVPGLAG